MSISALGASPIFTAAGLSRLNTPADETGTSAVRAAFDAEAQKTPAERMREALLKRLGLKESDLATMSTEERQAVEAKLAEMIKQEVEMRAQNDRPGKILDLKA